MPHDDDIRNDADFLERIEKLQRDNTVQFLRLLQDAKSPPSGSGKRGGDLLFDLARLSLRSYEQWIKLSAHGLERVADSMCLDPEGRACDPPAKSTPRVPLRMTARPGDVTGASFVVENPYDQAAVVRFTTPALKTSDGKILSARLHVAAPVARTPPRGRGARSRARQERPPRAGDRGRSGRRGRSLPRRELRPGARSRRRAAGGGGQRGAVDADGVPFHADRQGSVQGAGVPSDEPFPEHGAIALSATRPVLGCCHPRRRDAGRGRRSSRHDRAQVDRPSG